MAISRFQMKRQLRAYGGIMGQDGRRNYGVITCLTFGALQKNIFDKTNKTSTIFGSGGGT